MTKCVVVTNQFRDHLPQYWIGHWTPTKHHAKIYDLINPTHALHRHWTQESTTVKNVIKDK